MATKLYFKQYKELWNGDEALATKVILTAMLILTPWLLIPMYHYQLRGDKE